MKKRIILPLVVLSFLAVTAHAKTDFGLTLPASPSTIATSSPMCVQFERNIGLGSKDNFDRKEIKELQKFLRGKGHFKLESTGYFGSLTLQAVKDFQRANGLPPTGFVGILTRAKINALICFQQPSQPPVATSSIQVTAPKGGEVWQASSTQTIQWTDSNTYIQEPKYDVKLQLDLDCKPNQPCVLLYPMPVTIAKNISRTGTGYSWTVGSTTEANRQVTNGKYRVFVCPTGGVTENLDGCGKSASYITITNATSTVTVASLSTTTGPVGTKIVFFDTNIKSIKNINFGTGYIPVDPSQVFVNTHNQTKVVNFSVPTQLTPACYFTTPRCLIATVVTPAGTYPVSLTYTDGTKSAELQFTVTQ